MLLVDVAGTLSAWSHGDHPAARRLADQNGFAAVRTLLRLRLVDVDGALARAKLVPAPPDNSASIGTYVQNVDEAEWVALNARIFATHPEQGRLTLDDLLAREHEDWFQSPDFLVARDGSGRMVGYNWLKIEPGAREGEIYVVGVDPEWAGRGLGRLLMSRALERLSERGCREALLYVEADNLPAVHLYRSIGFVDDTIDVQYVRG